jgi:hypothetical protein
MNESETAASKISELLVEEQRAGGGFTIKNPNAKSTFGCGRPSRPSRSGADELCSGTPTWLTRAVIRAALETAARHSALWRRS